MLAPGVFIATDARIDIKQTFKYLTEGKAGNGMKFLVALHKTLAELAGLPHLSSPKFFAHPQLHDIRQWPVRDFKGYLILYRAFASAGGLEVLRVLHGSRDIQLHLESALDED